MAVGTNTIGTIQKYQVVDGTKPNAGSPSVEDATNADIKTAYELNADTNAYTDAEQTKLAGVESLAEVNPVDTDGLPEGATNKYASTEAKRLGVIQSLTASATTTFDPKIGRISVFDMDANIANLGASAGAFDGQLALLIFKQDATGSRTLTYNTANFEGGLDVGVPVLFGTANTRSYALIAWNVTVSKWDFLSFARRYP